MAIAEVLHIPPWEQQHRLTVVEFQQAVAYIQHLEQEAAKQK